MFPVQATAVDTHSLVAWINSHCQEFSAQAWIVPRIVLTHTGSNCKKFIISCRRALGAILASYAISVPNIHLAQLLHAVTTAAGMG